ncbi:uncharacterized protein LOC112094321 [Morus notabilis]|uniref:uncharacterized protein LOC112094321 n=1 Tax=Morus notabilis TaxID=981085 RepID=UPI000CECF2E9|nr:uncharacterized protein LOC112094321 [Morus notabilis]
MVYNLVSTPDIVQQVKQNQWQDPHLQGIWIRIQNGEQFKDWRIREDGTLLTKSAYFIPFRATYSRKILSELYLEHIVRLHEVPLSITSDRDTRFNARYQASIGMVPFEALYGRPCRSPVCWLEPEDRLTTGPDVIQENDEKIAVIRERLLTAQSRQKSYADRRHRPLEFQEGDFVLLKVSPRKGVTRFGVKGKLAPRYIGPFPIVQRVGVVAYRLTLPPELSHVHDVFHVSMLRKCQPYPEAVVQWYDVPIQDDTTYDEVPVQIIDRKMKSLRHREIPLMKVLWQHHGGEEATCELETTMQECYLHLFVI